MMLAIFSEALGAGRAFADKHSHRLELGGEVIALCLTNPGSEVLGGLACRVSLSQTAVNDGAEARNERPPIVATALSLVTMVACTRIRTAFAHRSDVK